MSAVTCSEQRDGAEVGELRVRDVELGEGLDVVVDLADAGRHLLHVDGRVVAGESVLLVADYDGQQAGDGHLAADLRQPQHEEVAPAVPHQTHLALVPAPSHISDQLLRRPPNGPLYNLMSFSSPIIAV